MSKTTNSTPKKGRYTDGEIIAALKASGGMVYLAAKALGCDPVTIYNRREKSAAVREAIENTRGEMLDIAETALKSAVVAKEAWAVCFTLKTIGKHRGYVERVEQTGANGGAIQIQATDYRVAVKPLTTNESS